MIGKHVTFRTLLLVAVVALLAGCAPAVHSAPAPTTPAQSTAKPHPTASQAAFPSVRVPVTCASLLTDASAASIMGSPVKARRDETTQPVDITDITSRQYGALDCLWGGDGEDQGYDQDVTIEIVPDAAAGFTANLASFANQDAPVTSNTAGDRSVYGCAVEPDLHCTGNMLVGSFWVTAYIQNLGGDPVSQATASARMQQVLTAVASPLKTAVAAKAWVPPTGTLPTFCSAPGSTAQVNAALGVSDFTMVGDDEQATDAASYTQQAGISAQCGWSDNRDSPGSFSYLSVGLLRGGAWVLPQLPGATNTKAYMLGAYTAMSIPGATAAAGNCSLAADECQVAVAIGSLFLVINIDDPSAAQSSAALAKIIAAVKAS